MIMWSDTCMYSHNGSLIIVFPWLWWYSLSLHAARDMQSSFGLHAVYLAVYKRFCTQLYIRTVAPNFVLQMLISMIWNVIKMTVLVFFRNNEAMKPFYQLKNNSLVVFSLFSINLCWVRLAINLPIIENHNRTQSLGSDPFSLFFI